MLTVKIKSVATSLQHVWQLAMASVPNILNFSNWFLILKEETKKMRKKCWLGKASEKAEKLLSLNISFVEPVNCRVDFFNILFQGCWIYTDYKEIVPHPWHCLYFTSEVSKILSYLKSKWSQRFWVTITASDHRPRSPKATINVKQIISEPEGAAFSFSSEIQRSSSFLFICHLPPLWRGRTDNPIGKHLRLHSASR